MAHHSSPLGSSFVRQLDSTAAADYSRQAQYPKISAYQTQPHDQTATAGVATYQLKPSSSIPGTEQPAYNPSCSTSPAFPTVSSSSFPHYYRQQPQSESTYHSSPLAAPSGFTNDNFVGLPQTVSGVSTTTAIQGQVNHYDSSSSASTSSGVYDTKLANFGIFQAQQQRQQQQQHLFYSANGASHRDQTQPPVTGAASGIPNTLTDADHATDGAVYHHSLTTGMSSSKVEYPLAAHSIHSPYATTTASSSSVKDSFLPPSSQYPNPNHSRQHNQVNPNYIPLGVAPTVALSPTTTAAADQTDAAAAAANQRYAAMARQSILGSLPFESQINNQQQQYQHYSQQLYGNDGFYNQPQPLSALANGTQSSTPYSSSSSPTQTSATATSAAEQPLLQPPIALPSEKRYLSHLNRLPHPLPPNNSLVNNNSIINNEESVVEEPPVSAADSSSYVSSSTPPAPLPATKVETLTKSANTRINPAFVPRPVLNTDPIGPPGGKRFDSTKYSVPPPPYGVYTIVDGGNASCRFIRSSLNQIPAASQTLSTSGIPLVIVASPFPVQGEFEDPVPCVNLNKGKSIVPADAVEEGPLRCYRCHSYVSPFMSFLDDQSAACNFCGYQFVLPKHYQYALSEYTRLRHSRGCSIEPLQEVPELAPFNRLELTKGTVDWVAPFSFLECTSGPGAVSGLAASQTNMALNETCLPPPAFCFAIDTSASAIECGLTAAAIGAIKHCLKSITNASSTICIVTFDQAIKFYLIKRRNSESQQQRKVFTVADTADPFFPLHTNELLLSPIQFRPELESFLEELPKLIQDSFCTGATGATAATTQSCGNAALRACVGLLESRNGGGAVKIFYGGSCDVGVGCIPKIKLSKATSKTAQSTQHPLHPVADLNNFYRDLVNDCLDSGIAVDVFIASRPNKHVGLSTLSYTARKTGGYCNYYSNIGSMIDYNRLCMELARQFQLPQAFNCVFKIRCSRGFTASQMLTAASVGQKDAGGSSSSSGDFHSNDPSQFKLSRIDGDQTLAFELKHQGEVPDALKHVYIQYAVLHTTLEGFRRIRIVTIAIPLTNSISTTFRYSEVECVLLYMVRKFANASMTSASAAHKENLIKEIVEILFAYRFHCAASTSAGQLILPDALKTLPLYICSLLKHAAFRHSATDLYTDERDFLLYRLLYMPLHQLIISVYPRLYVLHRSYTKLTGEKLHKVGTNTGTEDEVYLPILVATTGERITTDGIYLLDDGIVLMLYVGADVDQKVTEQMFGTTNIRDVQPSTFSCEDLKGDLGVCINRAINQLRMVKGSQHSWQPVVLVHPKSLEESLLLRHLVEDKLGTEPSYVDFLCQVHKSVHQRMEDA